MSNTPSSADAADILWFLPTHGDGRYLGTEVGARHVTLGYLSQIARAADDLGYHGRSAPHREVLRGLLGHRLGHGAADAKTTLPRRGSPGPLRTIDDRPDGGNARSSVRGPGPDQCRRRRRPGRNAWRWRLVRSRRTLQGDSRIPDRMATAHARTDSRFQWRSCARGRREITVSASSNTLSSALFWRFIRPPARTSRPNIATST